MSILAKRLLCNECESNISLNLQIILLQENA